MFLGKVWMVMHTPMETCMCRLQILNPFVFSVFSPFLLRLHGVKTLVETSGDKFKITATE